jgi:Methyltransferase domain/Glycosyl transferase family 2
MTGPLVSCIMPTYNRRPFIPHAIDYFLRQTYTNRELIILDDGADAIGDLVPSDATVRYERLPKKMTIGAKLNLGCELARGDIIAQFDDDDWYAPWRLAYQVDTLLREMTDLCGINQLLYYDLRTGRGYEYRYPPNQKTWLVGSDLLYTKAFWRGHPFANVNVGEDGIFAWSAARRNISVLDDRSFAVHMIHSRNVSPKRLAGNYWHPHSIEEFERVMGDDWSYYLRTGNNNQPYPRPRVAAKTGVAGSAGPASVPSAVPLTVPPVPIRNVFACLVHEKPECVIDLVSNLRCLDEQSRILLYDGSSDGTLLDNRLPWSRWGVDICPQPRPMKWGRLHIFALDCLRHLRSRESFDVMTIVDSDQLALRSGYSDFLAQRLTNRAGLGLLSSLPERQGPKTRIAPCLTAHQEIGHWRPLLKRFPGGEDKFVHWSFWPSTVITAEAGSALLDLFDHDEELSRILAASRLWATEEVLFPTLTALLGFRIERNPCTYDYVKYRMAYSLRDIETACQRLDAFWVHPIPRHYADAVRVRIRQVHDDYRRAGASSNVAGPPRTDLLFPILQQMRKIEGWLEDEEAELLAIAVRETAGRDAKPKAIVEIGSYCGKTTFVLATIAKACNPQSRIIAVDTFDGVVGALDRGLAQHGPTLEKFKRMLQESGLAPLVDIHVGRAPSLIWERPIDLLVVDGLHDYASVAQDFHAFEGMLAPGALAAFHDYADYFPGVRRLVDELLEGSNWTEVAQAGTLKLLRRQTAACNVRRDSCGLSPKRSLIA